jgi:PTS system nitrogen regulatory IIA component
MDLSDIIRPEHSFVGVQASTKLRALEYLASKASEAFGVERTAVLQALESRESLGSTGCGNGIAMPHAAIEGMAGPRGLLVRFVRPLRFEAIDDIPVDIAVLLLFGAANRGEYLNVLAAVARQLRSETLMRAMRAARSPEEMYATFVMEGPAEA